MTPGPGAYGIEKAIVGKPVTAPEVSASNDEKKFRFKGPSLWSTKGGVEPAFGSQRSRFEENVDDIPPPGAYDTIHSFEELKKKGKGSLPGVLASQAPRRALFKGFFKLMLVQTGLPGPAEYLPIMPTKKVQRRPVGGFLTSGTRFSSTKIDDSIPGPGTYQSMKSNLIKKSYNSTFDSAADNQ